MSELAPAWLVAWRERQGMAQAAQPPAQREPRTRRGCSSAKPVVSAVATAQRLRSNPFGFVEPDRWPYDAGTRREAVLDADHSPPRVVRRVGWRSCMACGSPFFSLDVVALRLCDGPDGCRAPKPR